MTMRKPGPDGGRTTTTDEAGSVDGLSVQTTPTDEVVVQPVGAKAPARRGRYAGVSDEDRAEIESAIAELWREYKTTGEERLRSSYAQAHPRA